MKLDEIRTRINISVKLTKSRPQSIIEEVNLNKLEAKIQFRLWKLAERLEKKYNKKLKEGLL